MVGGGAPMDGPSARQQHARCGVTPRELSLSLCASNVQVEFAGQRKTINFPGEGVVRELRDYRIGHCFQTNGVLTHVNRGKSS